MHGRLGRLMGKYSEEMFFEGDQSALNPMRYIPTPFHTKLAQARTPLSQYIQQEAVGTHMRRWQRPLHDFLMPYLRGTIARVTGADVIPSWLNCRSSAIPRKHKNTRCFPPVLPLVTIPNRFHPPPARPLYLTLCQRSASRARRQTALPPCRPLSDPVFPPATLQIHCHQQGHPEPENGQAVIPGSGPWESKYRAVQGVLSSLPPPIFP
ncbi:MAG: hypothetical protein WBW84_18590 [Acidobacteriaceae bacterium]